MEYSEEISFGVSDTKDNRLLNISILKLNEQGKVEAMECIDIPLSVKNREELITMLENSKANSFFC